MRREASCGAIAKETSVGGTSISSNEPDMESFAADGCQTQVLLCGVRAEQSGERLAETLRVLAETLEILLEGEVKAVSKSQPAATSFATDSITAKKRRDTGSAR